MHVDLQGHRTPASAATAAPDSLAQLPHWMRIQAGPVRDQMPPGAPLKNQRQVVRAGSTRLQAGSSGGRAES